MNATNISPLSILLLLLLVGSAAMAVPLNPASSQIMTPFHRSLQGVYGY